MYQKHSYRALAGLSIGAALFFRSRLVVPFFAFFFISTGLVYLYSMASSAYEYKVRSFISINQHDIDTYAKKNPSLNIPPQESELSLADIVGTDANKNGLRDHPERIMKYLYTKKLKKVSLSNVNKLLLSNTKSILKAAYKQSKKAKKNIQSYKEMLREHGNFEYKNLKISYSSKLYSENKLSLLAPFMIVMKAVTNTSISNSIHDLREDPYERNGYRMVRF